MKIFVTGATGYLGYHFVKVAIAQGHKVLCLGRPTSVSLFEPIVEKKIQWVNNDDEVKLLETVNAFQPDVLFHAAWGGVRGAGRDDAAIQQENLVMSRKLYQLYPYKQIIGLGSQGEYGFYEGLAYEDQQLNPLTLYGKAKAQTHLGWQPRLSTKEAIELTADWYMRYKSEDVYNLCIEEINKYNKHE